MQAQGSQIITTTFKKKKIQEATTIKYIRFCKNIINLWFADSCIIVGGCGSGDSEFSFTISVQHKVYTEKNIYQELI